MYDRYIEGGYFMEQKRLYRSSTNKMISGVCGGVAEYINIDPTVVRLLWVVFAFSGFGILAYILAAIIMPYQS
jgi:phage shock protein C